MRNNLLARSVLSAAVVLCAVISMPHEVRAYTTDRLPSGEVFGDFVVGPGKIDVELTPGESKTFELTVSNRMGDEREFEIQVEDMEGSEDPSQVVVLLGTERGPYSLRDYFVFDDSDKKFTIPHATKARVPVTITIPKDAEPGGFYGSVLFTTTSKKTTNEQGEVVGGAAIVSRIGVLFFVTVPGETNEAGALESFTTKAQQLFFTQGEVTLQALFRNSGNLHLRPEGAIKITNMLGTPIETITVDPWFVLPHALRLREITWQRAGLVGRYTAELTLKRGYNDASDTMKTTFWVIPLIPAALVLAVIFIIFFIIRYMVTHIEIRRK